MSNLIAFPSATPNIGLPLLSAGQAQKEFFVNQALTILDSLHPSAILGSLSAPPATAEEGDCFRVTAPAAQAWAGCENHIAARIGGDWHFIAPREGMHLFDIAAESSLFFKTIWRTTRRVNTPTGGLMIDIEARNAIEQLIVALQNIGVLPPPSV